MKKQRKKYIPSSEQKIRSRKNRPKSIDVFSNETNETEMLSETKIWNNNNSHESKIALIVEERVLEYVDDISIKAN